MEQIDTLWLFPVPCISTEHCICLFKQLFADNGRNHILYDTPLGFIPLYQPLFERQKNKITLNRNGELALEYAKRIVSETEDMAERIRALDRSLHTITVGSCAPAPLWDSIQLLSNLYPDMTISYDIKEQDKLLQGFIDKAYQIIILTEPLEDKDAYNVRYGEENLFFSLPPGHALAGQKELYLKDMDGETMLLHSKIGFWYKLHLEKMPSTHFLLQDDYMTFSELVKASALPSFTSDIVMKREGRPENRSIIPILDEEVHVTYYCICHSEDKHKLAAFFEKTEKGER